MNFENMALIEIIYWISTIIGGKKPSGSGKAKKG